MVDMVSAAVVHQHTNNFGDDAAGSALVTALLDTSAAQRVEVFYIWDHGTGGLPIADPRVRHHRLKLLSGNADRRPLLAVSAAASLVSPALIRGELGRFARACQATDLVYVAPAGSNLGIYKDWMYLLSLVVLIRSGCRPIFCQNTIGPSNSRVFDMIARWVLRRSRVLVRESRSQRFLAAHGISAELGVDTALALAVPQAPPTTPSPGPITIVPTRLGSWHRDHQGFDDTAFLGEELPAGVAQVATELGLPVRVLAHLYGPEAEDDWLALVADGLRRNGCVAEVVHPTSYVEYAVALAQSTAVVSMRYHGLVLSGLTATPCLALAYENKMVEAATYLGQADHVHDVTSMDPAAIASGLRMVVAQTTQIREDLADRRGDLRKAALGPVRLALSRRVHVA